MCCVQKADKDKRPSDKAGALRDYGLLDRDLWGLSELRGWFNKRAPATPSEVRDLRFTSGHTIRRSATTQLRKPQTAPHMARHTNRFTKPLTPMRLPPAGVVPGRRPNRSTHWIDHEGGLAAQTRQAAALRQSGKLPTSLAKPWKDRPVEDVRVGVCWCVHAVSQLSCGHWMGLGMAGPVCNRKGSCRTSTTTKENNKTCGSNRGWRSGESWCKREFATCKAGPAICCTTRPKVHSTSRGCACSSGAVSNIRTTICVIETKKQAKP